MIDDETWSWMRDELSSVGAAASRAATDKHPLEDPYGRVHMLVAMDQKQLPPATSKPSFIAGDPEFLKTFQFRVLRQNRRLTVGQTEEEQLALDTFHGVLEDVAYGKDTPRVREALVAAYVRGAQRSQKTVDFENGIACVTKRRYRDRWNGKMLTRIGHRYGRSLRVKAVFLARGSQKQWVREAAARDIRRTVRSQCLTTLRLAGQWSGDPPTRGEGTPHCMRVMLVANLDVEHGFANGATGRLTRWYPEFAATGEKVKSVRANVPEVQARFYHEASYNSKKRYSLSEMDWTDIEPRKEVVGAAKGKPSMLQLTVQPAYCLTIRKVQALTKKACGRWMH